MDIGRTLLAARSMPHREMILFAELWTKQQPERGVLARIKDVPVDLSRTPVSAMYEDNLTELVYLIPRPTRNGTWDLIVGDTFDAGEGDCTEEYQQ